MSAVKEHKMWFRTGELKLHCWVLVVGEETGLYGHKHGEFKLFDGDGTVWSHRFYRYNRLITEEVKAEFDIDNLSDEDKVYIKLKWGIECLP